MKHIVVVGSLNMDLVVRTSRLPRPGETIQGNQFETIPGGKGANQAVAASRLASSDIKVSMIGCVGEDAFGTSLVESLRESKVNTDHVHRVQEPTGTAIIAVEEGGENFIIISSGANGVLAPSDIESLATMLRSADALLLQLEVPLTVVERAASLASEGGALVILNPAPARPLPPSLLEHISYLIPNESEATSLTGLDNTVDAAKALRQLDVDSVVVTLGRNGALVVSARGETTVPSFPITPVDTTAAGDAFVGALAVALVEGRDEREAVRFACAAGALAATRPGAQPSLPTREELLAFIESAS